MVIGIGWVCVWPALTNLSGRKPRGLGGTYGESLRSAMIGMVLPRTD